MHNDVRKYLFDMQQACERIADYTQGKSFEDYLQDSMLRSAVERQFTIVGEALSQALRIEPCLADQITRFRRIINFRNVIVHGYAHVIHETVWGVVVRDLPRLRGELAALLADESRE